jgi:hypothetical protein
MLEPQMRRKSENKPSRDGKLRHVQVHSRDESNLATVN